MEDLSGIAMEQIAKSKIVPVIALDDAANAVPKAEIWDVHRPKVMRLFFMIGS